MGANIPDSIVSESPELRVSGLGRLHWFGAVHVAPGTA